MKNFTILIIAILFFQNVSAQSSLSGNINDESNESIFFATVVLYNNSDSTISQAISSNSEGTYKLKNIKDGDYYLEVSFLGYIKERKSDLKFPRDNNLKLNMNLKAEEQMLEAVVIVGKKPLLVQESDRLVVNVADNITTGTGNLMDVMKKVPGIIVAGDKLSLAGATNLTILINGKTTKYMDVESLLRDMPGDNIQKVEIIHQPGAEFDAAGSGPVINIILKKNSLFGTNGKVNFDVSKRKYWQYKTGLTLSHYQGNVNIHGGFGYRNAGYNEAMTIDRNVMSDNYYQVSDMSYKSKNYRGNLSVDWDINKRHRVGFQSRYIDHRSVDGIDNVTDITFADLTADVSIRTDNNKNGYWKFGTINPFYVFQIDTLGQKLEVDFNYIQYNGNSENILTPNNNDSILKYNEPGNTKIIVGKVDYTYPFSKHLKLQIGAKYSIADLDNDFEARSQAFDNNIWNYNSMQSNHYLFDETINAGYTKLSFNKSKWSGTLGLRYEDSNSKGESVGVDTTLSRRIKQFFPSASLSRDIIKGLSGTLSYSYRLDRPRYSSLNPFRYSLDSYTSHRGNPELRPEFTHSMKFNLAFDKQPFFNVEYKLSNDAIIEVFEQEDATGQAFKSNINIDSKKILNLSLYFPLDFIPKLSGYGGIITNRAHYKSPYLDQVFDKSKWDYTAFLQVNFTLPWKIKTELSGWYTSGGMRGLMNSEWMYGTSFGFSKTFFKNRAKISLGVYDIFNRFYYSNVTYSNIDADINSKWDARVYHIEFSYKFGNRHMQSKKHKSSASEELNRADK